MTAAPEGWPRGLPPPVEESPLSGGMICTTTRAVLADGRRVIVKRCPYPADVEADGLDALRAGGAPVPAVLGLSDGVLVLEEVGGTADWEELGRAIAALHRSQGPAYGWHRANRIGVLEQRNGWHDHWPDFYAEQRVRVHLRDPAVPADLARRLDRACDGPLRDLLDTGPPASLVHGDLWAGNVVDGRWLIDPAVSYADREHELAFMALFGNFPAALHRAYEEAWPVPEGYERRRPALQLHHLLVHVRHFGASYVPALTGTLGVLGW